VGAAAGLVVWAAATLSCGDSSSASGPTSSSTGGGGATGGGGSTAAAGGGGDGAGGASPAGGGGVGAGGEGGVCIPSADDLPPLASPPAALSDTGLYEDISSETLGANVRSFEPAYVLWSDGATKDRYVYLPSCDPIDTSDMNHWSLPVGTRLWKTFTVMGTRIETRLIHRFGPGPDDFFFAAYEWRDDLSDADYVPGGVVDAKGTAHDIPSTPLCVSCHGYLPERSLGFSALQLSHPSAGVNLDLLVSEGRLSAPPATTPAIPGDATARAALGYLHANCGHCHNESGIVFDNPFSLRMSVDVATVEQTDAYLTGVGVPVEKFVSPGVTHRIASGDPDASCVAVRMGIRGTTQQMPPVGTEIVDPTGLSAVTAWIESL
jgi:hypothetical protein